MPHLSLALLGQFRATLDGQLITNFQSDKVRALLAYLASETEPAALRSGAETGKTYSRNGLATLFWDGYREESARNSLRQALYHLRRALGDDDLADESTGFLQITRQTVEFNPRASFTSDVHRFRQLLADCANHAHSRIDECPACLARLQQAVDLYKGEFLAGFAINDSAAFEEWRRIQQETLHIEALDALTHLTNAALKSGKYELARKSILGQMQLEPWREETHRQLMRVLALLGDRSAAITQYHACKHLLLEELGIEPDASTVQLYEQIRSGNFPDKNAIAAVAVPLVEAAPSPNGRHAESAVASSETAEQSVQPLPVADAHTPPNHASSNPVQINHQLRLNGQQTQLATAPVQQHHHNLPMQLTPLVGRQREIEELLAYLQQPQPRLLTLVGPGGIGKTRLAQHVGALQVAAFADGVFFVRLEAINDPAAIAAEIAAVIGLRLQGNQPQQELLQLLHSRQMLLLIDNFEHLLSGSLLVAALLEATEQLKIIVTSRERLNIPGEQIFIVDGLSYPALEELEKAESSTAVRLFVESGQRVLPGFQLNATTLPGIVRICRMLQGMPLALELAAAWLEILPVAEIADEIARSVDFLTVDWRRTLPTRQQSMRAVFAWSWQLLTESERIVFCRLSIFRGGFTREAAAKVAGATLRTLAGFVHKSLLRISDPQAAQPRYQIHELLRQFAAEELVALGEERVVAQNHSDFYLTYVATRERLFHAESAAVVVEFQNELDNIRHGWNWAVDHQNCAALRNSVHALAQFYYVTGLVAQGVQLFQYAAQSIERTHCAALSDAPDWSESERQCYWLLSSLNGCLAELLLMLGQYDEGAELADKGERLGRITQNHHGEVLCQFLLAKVLCIRGVYGEAQQRLSQTLTLVRSYRQDAAIEDRLAECELTTILWLGHLANLHDRFGDAQRYFDEGLRLARAKKRRRVEVSFLLNLAGMVLHGLGDFVTAKKHYLLALKLATEIGFRWGEGSALLELGNLLRLQGEYSTALEMFQRAWLIFEQINHPLKAIYSRLMMGRLYAYLGDSERAGRVLAPLPEELNDFAEDSSRQNALLGLAVYEFQLNQNEQALHYIAMGLDSLGEVGSQALRVGFLLLAGHCHSRMMQDAAAAASFQELLDRYAEKNLSAFTAEAHAGLANLAARQGDSPTALWHVEKILAILPENPNVGYDEPFFVYLTAYRILHAHNDPRADAILQQGYHLLEHYAAHIHDDSLRASFYNNVLVHRELQSAYCASHTLLPVSMLYAH